MSVLRRLFNKGKSTPKSKPTETNQEPEMSTTDPLTEITQKTNEITLTDTPTASANAPFETATFAMS